jgi:hypothetical protein
VNWSAGEPNLISSLCRGNAELKYEAAGDEDPDVPAWDDAGFDLDDFQDLNVGA